MDQLIEAVKELLGPDQDPPQRSEQAARDRLERLVASKDRPKHKKGNRLVRWSAVTSIAAAAVAAVLLVPTIDLQPRSESSETSLQVVFQQAAAAASEAPMAATDYWYTAIRHEGTSEPHVKFYIEHKWVQKSTGATAVLWEETFEDGSTETRPLSSDEWEWLHGNEVALSKQHYSDLEALADKDAVRAYIEELADGNRRELIAEEPELYNEADIDRNKFLAEETLRLSYLLSKEPVLPAGRAAALELAAEAADQSYVVDLGQRVDAVGRRGRAYSANDAFFGNQMTYIIDKNTGNILEFQLGPHDFEDPEAPGAAVLIPGWSETVLVAGYVDSMTSKTPIG